MIGELAAVGAVACWSWTAVFFTIASRRLGSWWVNVYRLLLGSFFLAGTVLLLGGSFAATGFQVKMLALSGVLGLTIGDLLLFLSFVRMGPRLTMLVYTISPALTALLAWVFLSETIGWMGFAGMVVTLAGILWTMMEKRGDGDRVHGWAVAYTIVAALGQAGGLILAKSALRTGMDSLLATLIRMVAAAGAALLITAFYHPAQGVKGMKGDRRALWALLGGAVFGPYLGVWLSQVSIKYAATGIAATILSTTPIFLIPVAALVEKEKITVHAVAGALVAVAGVALLFLH